MYNMTCDIINDTDKQNDKYMNIWTQFYIDTLVSQPIATVIWLTLTAVVIIIVTWLPVVLQLWTRGRD